MKKSGNKGAMQGYYEAEEQRKQRTFLLEAGGALFLVLRHHGSIVQEPGGVLGQGHFQSGGGGAQFSEPIAKGVLRCPPQFQRNAAGTAVSATLGQRGLAP